MPITPLRGAFQPFAHPETPTSCHGQGSLPPPTGAGGALGLVELTNKTPGVGPTWVPPCWLDCLVVSMGARPPMGAHPCGCPALCCLSSSALAGCVRGILGRVQASFQGDRPRHQFWGPPSTPSTPSMGAGRHPGPGDIQTFWGLLEEWERPETDGGQEVTSELLPVPGRAWYQKQGRPRNAGHPPGPGCHGPMPSGPLLRTSGTWTGSHAPIHRDRHMASLTLSTSHPGSGQA